MSLEELKAEVRAMGASYRDREQRSRRIFIQEQAQCLRDNRHKEFTIKSKVSKYFEVPYSSISFCGSGQLGFSVHKDRLFEPARSDLDVACIDANLFQKAWIDIIGTTSAFSDLTPFTRRDVASIDMFRDQILRRGMINISAMPQSPMKVRWTQFQDSIGREHRDLFGKITIAIYMNEYAFCWKQDSVLSELVGK